MIIIIKEKNSVTGRVIMRNFKGYLKGDLSKKISPFLVFSVPNSNKSHKLNPHIKGGLNPLWDEEGIIKVN